MSLSMRGRRLQPKRKSSLKRHGCAKMIKNQKIAPTPSQKCSKCDRTSSVSGPFEFPTIWEELRARNQLCDGVVKCENGITFNIHRIILSSISPYFRALFTNSLNNRMGEINEANVNISSSAFEVVLDYAYTGNCVINKSNVFEVFKCADQYEIPDVWQKCCNFLMDNLNPMNCLKILKFANQFFCRHLARKGNVYILQNFTEILYNNKDFLQLSLETLQEILSDDYLNAKSEEIVFEAIKMWIDDRGEERKCHLLDLIKCIRMGALTRKKILKIARWPLIESDTGCTLYITDILTVMQDFDTEIDPLNIYLGRPRIPYDILFAIGGWSAGSPTSFVETYDNRADRWLVSRDTDVVARAYHGICSHEGKIYIVGGFDGSEYFNTVRCFDPTIHKWSECACMHYSRCYVSVVICLKKIYAMGGYNGRVRMNSVERLDPLRNQWENVSSMQKQRSDASASVLNDKIYIVGGFNGQEVMNSAEMYDPEANQWTFIPSMISARSGVSLISYKNVLFAIGGFNGYTRLSTIEKYTPDFSTCWSETSEMLTPRSNFGTVILDNYIYVIGGFNGSTTIDYVEYFDPETGEWAEAAPMNLNRSALSACVISGLSNSKDYSFLEYSGKHDLTDTKFKF